MRRFFSALLSVLLMLGFIMPVQVFADTSEEPMRVINLVFDDSGSMDDADMSWSKAKYSLEVFAAMLGEKDTINVYFMSRDEGDAGLILKGSDGAAKNVENVHETIIAKGGTPFGTVKRAYADLAKKTADDKWLVVLTDGDWGNGVDPDAFFAEKADDVQVVYLSIGSRATTISSNESKDIYAYKAVSSQEILTKLIDVSTRIYNSNRLTVDTASNKVSFDVPMKELIVFVQGQTAQINGITKSDGISINKTQPVEVKYSDKEGRATDTSLVGSIATFKGDFDAGDYTLDVTGAETIEVYYKPNIEIAAYLIDGQGNRVSDLAKIKAGDYIIEFGLVKAGTTEAVPESKLLGNVTYEAIVYNDGQAHDKTYSNGDHITIGKGVLSIDVSAHYLEYHTVSTELNYSVYADKVITFNVVDNPTYKVISDGLDNTKPIVVKALIDGQEFSAEEWAQMGTPVGDIVSEIEFVLGELKVQKMDEIGIYHIYPTLENEKPSDGVYNDCDYTFNYVGEHDGANWYGTGNLTLQLEDDRSWIEQNQELFKKIVIYGLVFLFLLGYVPGIKKYLPRSLKKRPEIKVTKKEGYKRENYNEPGQFKKKLFTTILPYKAEEGSIIFVPDGLVTRAELKAGGGGMYLMNVKDFAGNKSIKFEGEAVEKDATKPILLSAGAYTNVTMGKTIYVCDFTAEYM